MSVISIQGKNSLIKEQKVFQEKKKELLKDSENKFVLIKNSEVIGTYETAEEAYKDGLEKIGNKPMYIKQVTKREPTPMLMGII